MSDDKGLFTQDEFLGGRLKILQPKHGYRAATDPIFLAAAVRAKSGESVLEIGCGVGVAILCLLARVRGLNAVGLEVQPDYAQLARENADANKMSLEVVQGDLLKMPSEIKEATFDHVIMNPPYFRQQAITPPNDAGKDIAHREQGANLQQFIHAGLRRLKQKGWLTMINKGDRLSDIVCALEGKAADIQILPLQARENEAAGRVIVRARKGSAGPLILHAPLIVHNQTASTGYSPMAEGILRHGKELNMQQNQRSDI